jgi:hypothetical protein
MRIHGQRLERFKRYLEAEAAGKHIIYFDECVFKPYKVQTRSWAHRYLNQDLPKEGCRLKTVALALCISSEKGIEGSFLRNGSITKHEIAFLISSIANQGGIADTVLFMDNLPGHYSHVVKEEL